MVEFAVAAGAFVDDGIVGDQHAAATGRQVLATAAAEATGTSPMEPRPRWFQVPPWAWGDVLDHGQAVSVGDGQDGLHVATHAAEVHRHDRAGARGDGGLDSRRCDVVGLGIDVGKDWNEARIQDGRHAGEEGDGRDDDLGAALEAEGLEGDLKGAGSAVEANPVAGVVGRGESLLEFDDRIVVGAVAGPQPLGQRRDVVLGEDGPGGE